MWVDELPKVLFPKSDRGGFVGVGGEFLGCVSVWEENSEGPKSIFITKGVFLCCVSGAVFYFGVSLNLPF